jgi:hypothetical protein
MRLEHHETAFLTVTVGYEVEKFLSADLFKNEVYAELLNIISKANKTDSCRSPQQSDWTL